MKIKNIIFDLGGVIIDIDYHRTAEAFKRLGAFNFDSVYSQSKQENFFDDFETGKLSPVDFRITLKSKLEISATDEEFDCAWNAMLLDIPTERLHFIRMLKEKYQIFLFSNTNEIHLKEVFSIRKKQNDVENFDGYFDKEYYSHIFGMRKPNPFSFTTILEQNNLIAEETLFIVDSTQHVIGAKMAGLQAHHLTADKSILQIPDFAIF